MQTLEKLVSQKLLDVLNQQQLTPDEIGGIQGKIGNDLTKSLEIIFTFYEDMNIFNESMIDQLMKEKEDAKLKEIFLLNSLSSLSVSQRIMPQNGGSGPINYQGQQIFQIVSQKIVQISKSFDSQNDLKSLQLINKQKESYEDQLKNNKIQIQQVKQDMRQIKADHQSKIQQLIRQNKESKQLLTKSHISAIEAVMSQINDSQKANFSKLYEEERQNTLRSQEAISNLTKYICELMKFDEQYNPDEGIEKWMNILKAKVQKYRKQIQISTGKKNAWEEKNPLKELLNHHSSKLIYRNYRLAG